MKTPTFCLMLALAAPLVADVGNPKINNNFEGVAAMVTKSAPLALNIPTFLNLWGYGYQNIYELRPFLDIKQTKIPFEGSDVLNQEEE